MKKIGEYLREKRGIKELSLREAAKLSGLSHQHIRDIEAGKKSPTFDKVINILKAYHADILEFLKETGYLPSNKEPVKGEKLYKIPLASWSIAESHGEVYGERKISNIQEWIGTGINNQNVFALRVRDDSMEPEFVEGDIIIVEHSGVQRHNDFVIAKKNTDIPIFRQLKKYGKTKVLHPLNPKYPDIKLTDKKHRYKIIGKVVEKKKRY